MTIKYPEDNIFDSMLKLLGKKRKVLLPDNTGEIYNKNSQHTTIVAKKESFFKALFSIDRKR